MQRSNVTNNHLVSKFNEIGGYLEDGNEVPEYLFIQFVQELGVSNLLIPGIIEDDTLSFDILTSDDESIDVLPLFSDDEAFIECYGEDSEFSPIANDIRFYIDLLNESEIDGVLFNPDSVDFLLEKIRENIPHFFNLLSIISLISYSTDTGMSIIFSKSSLVYSAIFSFPVFP